MNPFVVIASNPGAAGERGSRDLRHIKSRLPLRRDCEDTRAACEFLGPLKAARGLKFLSLVHLRQKPTSGLLKSLSLSVAPAFHEQERSSGEVAWVAKKVSNRSTKL